MLNARNHIVVLLLAPILFCGTLFAVPDDRPTDLTPAANVDENLFVIRALAREYNRWPQDSWNGEEALKFCEQSRLNVKYLRSIVVKHKLDAGIRGMCDDYFTLMDEYESTLATIGSINDESRKKAIEDAVRTFFIGGIKAVKAAADADADGKSELGVDAAAGQALVDNGLKEFINHSKTRDAQTGDAVAAEQTRFVQVENYALARGGTAVQAMTQRYGWKEGEAGFDKVPEGMTLDNLVLRRQRDPFTLLQLAGTGVDGKNDVSDLINRARMCLDAVKLIPAGEEFQTYRMECMTPAVTYACNAAEFGIESTYRDAPTHNAQEAINITQSTLQLNPQDSDGWLHVQLFRALACAGRFDEAEQAAQPVLDSAWNRHLGFALRYARVMGNTGNVDQQERWLRQAYILGFSDLKFVKESPDFDNLRTKKADDYAELTTVKGTTRVEFGLVNDDVLVINRSPFPMTNLKMKFTVIKGGQIWEKERTLPFVAANSQETLGNVFMIPDSRYDAYRWSLTSDQGNLSSEDQ